MPTRPKFSIIAVDYDGHVPREGMKAGLQSLADQTFKDYELIIIHDGPKTIPYEEEFDFSVFKNPPVFLNTPYRINDWGHSSRDMGMRVASGDYFLQFNIDNIHFPHALEKISQRIDETGDPIIIFSIYHFKINGDSEPFRGLPPVYCNIDALQLVASRQTWEEVGYWYEKEPSADGVIYQDMCTKFNYSHIEEVLGNNY